jgi:ribosomal protein L7/L12
MVEKAPTMIKTQVHKLEAEELKTKLIECGANIEFC